MSEVKFSIVASILVQLSAAVLCRGEISVLSFGAVGDGVTDDSPSINLAITSLRESPGQTLRFPGGRVYAIKSPIVFPGTVAGLEIAGDGDTTVFQRMADLPDGQGMFDIQGANGLSFVNFVVDGSKYDPDCVQYGTFTYPTDPILVKNTSFWIHGGSKSLRFDGITVRHTGGYAALAYTQAEGNIEDVSFVNCLFENNRPHSFWSDPNDKLGPSWTGGILYRNRATQPGDSAVVNLSVRNCRFQRNNGNGVWGHSDGFSVQHRNVAVTDNHFEDMALDGVELGNTTGGIVANNFFHRIGYITANDDDAPAPKHWGVAIDSTGWVKSVSYTGNTILNANGGCIDLDGFFQGAVTKNLCLISEPGEPLFTSDRVADFGDGRGNITYGINPGNTFYRDGGLNVTISGNTIRNMGAWAIGGANLKDGTIRDNVIVHPSTALYAPIFLMCRPGFDEGDYHSGDDDPAGSSYRAWGNLVTNNRVEYSGPHFVVEEIDYSDGQGTHSFHASDINRVCSNQISGANGGEFLWSANSGSYSAATSGCVTNLKLDRAIVIREVPRHIIHVQE
ncbi:MAG TPA: right-handed parallel beta-helix repeat-containing protein [Bryobacteraceae bacterium]|nr:right-handed parallel beta-helix repeat-containing protein [Bryobacteraceae bacterium]